MPCGDDLPLEVWTQVLQHVPYKERLSVFALVSQKLAKAAAAATTSLDLSLHQLQLDAFLRWLQNNSHGSSLTSWCLTARCPNDSSIRQLPCPNLLELQLSNCSVQLLASSKELGLLHSCTAVTRLDLCVMTVLDSSSDGPAGAMPGAVAQLQHLRLDTCGLFGEAKAYQALREQLVPQLTCLTSLEISSLRGIELSSLLLLHISTMARLQKLSWSAEILTSPTLPGIEHLIPLKSLRLYNCDLEPSCLLPITTGLTGFTLNQVTLHPRQAQQDSELGVSQLLQLLARLTALQELALLDLSGDWPQQLSAHSVLTASSHLRTLEINNNRVEGAAWSHVFPAGRKLPHLEILWGCEVLASDDCPAPFSSADITRLVSCCPALQQLHMIMCGNACMAPLQSLTALTFLCVGAVTPDAIRSNLAAMTQLQRLQVVFPPPAPGDEAPSVLQHLVPLTALTGLTCLIADLGEPEAEDLYLRIEDKAPDGCPPDVWVQLLELCATDPAAQPAITSCMLQQLKYQWEYCGHQAAQLAGVSVETAELRGRLQATEIRVQGLEGQLQASDGKVQALEQQLQAADGRVQVLERQMQEVLAALQRRE